MPPSVKLDSVRLDPDSLISGSPTTSMALSSLFTDAAKLLASDDELPLLHEVTENEVHNPAVDDEDADDHDEGESLVYLHSSPEEDGAPGDAGEFSEYEEFEESSEDSDYSGDEEDDDEGEPCGPELSEMKSMVLFARSLLADREAASAERFEEGLVEISEAREQDEDRDPAPEWSRRASALQVFEVPRNSREQLRFWLRGTLAYFSSDRCGFHEGCVKNTLAKLEGLLDLWHIRHDDELCAFVFRILAALALEEQSALVISKKASLLEIAMELVEEAPAGAELHSISLMFLYNMCEHESVTTSMANFPAMDPLLDLLDDEALPPRSAALAIRILLNVTAPHGSLREITGLGFARSLLNLLRFDAPTDPELAAEVLRALDRICECPNGSLTDYLNACNRATMLALERVAWELRVDPEIQTPGDLLLTVARSRWRALELCAGKAEAGLALQRFYRRGKRWAVLGSSSSEDEDDSFADDHDFDRGFGNEMRRPSECEDALQAVLDDSLMEREEECRWQFGSPEKPLFPEFDRWRAKEIQRARAYKIEKLRAQLQEEQKRWSELREEKAERLNGGGAPQSRLDFLALEEAVVRRRTRWKEKLRSLADELVYGLE